MSNNNKTDYGELFCEAIDTIVAERLNAVTKDVTVLCTVVDDSKRQEGKYVVTETNSQTKFEAFSDNTEYRKDNNVYVTIPKGDMNEAKFIIGKKQKDELEEAYTYTNPFDTIVDVSGNLITAEIPVERAGLVANEPDVDGYDDGYQTITLWTYNLTANTVVADKGEQLKGFTRLGIRGSFRSWLNQFYVEVNGKSIAAAAKAGSYGLRLRLQTINENVVNETDKEGYYDLYLDAEDMNGNPYNFQTFYRQEKIFDIENIGQIVSMELQLYEKPDTFINNVNEDLIPWQDFLGNKINPNIFVKDCYICVGYDVASFEDDQVMLYTLNDGTYRPDATDVENQKLVQLRWVNDFGNKIKVVNETDNLNADVRWYRYQLGAPSPDEYAGYHWTRVNDKITVTQSAPIEEIDSYSSFRLVSPYQEVGNDDTDYRMREYFYERNFKPEYTTGTPTQGLDGDDSIVALWTQECRDYYHIGDEIKDVAFVGNQTTTFTKDEKQTWQDIMNQGFILHNNPQSATDYFIGERQSNLCCLHPVRFWEQLSFAWRLYWLFPEKFDLLLTYNIWKTGGTKSTGLWNNIGYWGELAGHNYYDLRYNSSYVINLSNGTQFTANTSSTHALSNASTLFADSFGEWTLIEDKYGLGNYVPGRWIKNASGEWQPATAEDEATYNLLSSAIKEFFYKIDNPTYEIVLKPNGFSYLFTPDTTLQEERLKAIVLYEGEVLRSNTLYFYNEIEVPSQPTINAMSAAEIITLDASEGNYFIYDIGNSIKNHADSTEVRELDLYFNGAQLTIANEVEWLIPIQNTMIILDDEFKGVDFDEVSVPGYCKITRRGGGEKGDDITGSTKQRYRIKSYWSQDDTNNTIYCTIRQYGIDYPVVREFSFGPSGTSGTDCTLVLDFEDGITALTIGNPQVVVARARLYDYNNKLVDLTNYNINWNIFSGLTENAGTKTNLILTGHNDTREIQLKSTVTTVPTDNYDILQATVTNFGDYELTAYLPLPIKANTTYKYIEGATKLIYNSIGNIDNYYKDPYKLYYTDGENITSTFGVWTINNGVTGDVNYLPQLTTSIDRATSITTYSLQATSIYVPETCTKVNVTGSVNGDIVWSQPLLIMQNRYPSAMINEWDGSLKLDEENNAILAAKMIAGRKEDDNTFSGVMMGDWYGEDVEGEIADHTGIYGFNKGVASFGFRDNGTAFIGKPGSGRIEFDGEEGIITSNSYEGGAGGIKIDLDDGIFYAQSPKNGIDDDELDVSRMKKGYLTINAAHETTPLSIGKTEDGGRDNYFYVDWDGTFKARAGYIGPWIVDDDGFRNEDDTIYLNVDGTMRMGYGSDKIEMAQGVITIGNSENENQIILKSIATEEDPLTGIIIGPLSNQIRIGSGKVSVGNYDMSEEMSKIYGDWRNIVDMSATGLTVGRWNMKENIITTHTIINNDGVKVCFRGDEGHYVSDIELTSIDVRVPAVTITNLNGPAGTMERYGGLSVFSTSDPNSVVDVEGYRGVSLRSYSYGMDVVTDASELQVSDYHIGGTTYESAFSLEPTKGYFGMSLGKKGGEVDIPVNAGLLEVDLEGLYLTGKNIQFKLCDSISFSSSGGDKVEIDFSTVDAKNLYAVLA